MNTAHELQARIMRRVWGIYIVRQVTSPAIRVGVFVAAFLVLIGSVSMPNVVANAFHVTTLSGFFSFGLSAFTNTTLLVQITSIVVGFVLISSLIEIGKKIANPNSSYA